MNESTAARYQRLRRRSQTAGTVCGGAVLGAVALTPAASLLAQLASRVGRGLAEPWHQTAALAAFVLILVALWELAALPAALYQGLHLERRPGQADVHPEAVLAVQAQAALAVFPAAFVGALAVRLAVWLTGPWWWLTAGVLLVVPLVMALHVVPGVLARLAGARPLARSDLRDHLAALAHRSGVTISSIEELPADATGRLTALVTGAGRRCRVFISTDLTRDWSDDEIAVVVAHELGHHAHRHLWRTLALDMALLWASLWAAHVALGLFAGPAGRANPGDLAMLPAVAFVAGLVWVAATPVRHFQSRRHERRADVFALALTGAADAFDAAIRRLGARHLAEERPTSFTRWFYHRHPSVTERLAMAERFRRMDVKVTKTAPR
jgi:Zn-dependent protease with chaperone function